MLHSANCIFWHLSLALPKPPGTPVVTESTATSITLTWDSGNPEPVSYYIIQHKPKNSEEPYKEIDGVATTRYSVAGLSPYSEYEFRVVAVNNIGRGPPSEPVSTRTSEQAPSSAPRNVQARMLSSTTILVQWEEPEEPNGQIQGYRVYYTMDPTQHVNSWMKHNVADSHITTIGNLVPQKTYSVKVLAFTSVGDGPLSSDIQVITQTGGKLALNRICVKQLNTCTNFAVKEFFIQAAFADNLFSVPQCKLSLKSGNYPLTFSFLLSLISRSLTEV